MTQKQRWWQEGPETTVSPMPTPIVPLEAVLEEVNSGPMDTWAELEAEAAARAVAAKQGEGETIAYCRSKAEQLKLQRSALIVNLLNVLPTTAYPCMMFLHHQHVDAFFFVLPLFCFLFVVSIYIVRVRAIVRQVEPMVCWSMTLSPEGVTLYHGDRGSNAGLMRWEEIEAVRAEPVPGYGKRRWFLGAKAPTMKVPPRYLSIVVKDPVAVAKRLRWTGFQRAINISSDFLPVPAEAIVAQITAYQAVNRD